LVVWRPPAIGPGRSWVEMAAVDVSFVGSRANDTTQGQTECVCGTALGIGSESSDFVDVEVPCGYACTPHTWSVTQLGGSSGGGFVVSTISAELNQVRSALPITIPECQGGQSYGGVTLWHETDVVAARPSIQTLYLTISVTEQN
jgi:hypothetical protein